MRAVCAMEGPTELAQKCQKNSWTTCDGKNGKEAEEKASKWQNKVKQCVSDQCLVSKEEQTRNPQRDPPISRRLSSTGSVGTG